MADREFDDDRARAARKNPVTAHGTEMVKLWWSGEAVSFKDALAKVDIQRKDVVARFGDWVVTLYGLECISNYYPIKKERLWEKYSWDRHLNEKRWVNMPAFLVAFEYAKGYHKKVDANG